MSVTRLLCASVFLLGIVACDGALDPEDTVGTYVVRTVREETLPVVLWHMESDTVRLAADTLRLRRDGTGTEVSIYESAGDVQHVANRVEQDFEFDIRDGMLEGGYTCRGICLAVFIPIRGHFTGEGLRLEVWKHGEGPIELERVD